MALGMGMSLQTSAILVEDAFVFTINTATVGSGFDGETDENSYILPLGDTFSGTVEVDWGDRSSNSEMLLIMIKLMNIHLQEFIQLNLLEILMVYKP